MAYTISDMLNDYMYETFGDVTTDAEFNSSNIIMSETTVTRGELRCYDEVGHQHIEDTVTGKKITLCYDYDTRVTDAEEVIKAGNRLIERLKYPHALNILKDADMGDIYEDYDLDSLESQGIISIEGGE